MAFNSNDVIDAIVVHLREMFGEDISIYTEEVPQDFHAPAFFVFSPDQRRIFMLEGKGIRDSRIQITYLPQEEGEDEWGEPPSADIREDLQRMQGELLETLPFVGLDGYRIRIKGGIETQIQDKELSVTFTVRLYDKYVEDFPLMEKIDINRALKE